MPSTRVWTRLLALPTARWRPLIETVVAGVVLPSRVFEAMVLVESNGDPNARRARFGALTPFWMRVDAGDVELS